MGNVPSTYTRELLIMTLNEERFEKLYNFMYMPVELVKEKVLRYAFVNFIDYETACAFKAKMAGYTNWLADTHGNRLAVDGDDVKAADVRWGKKGHSKEQLVEIYRDKPLMHSTVPDEWKPAVFDENG